MKVSEWYDLLKTQTYSVEDINKACMYRLVNIIFTTVGADVSRLGDKVITTENVTSVLEHVSLHASLIWKLLGLSKDTNYFRYYCLDMITNGQYLKPLIGHIYYLLYQYNAFFAFDFNESDFESKLPVETSINLQYMLTGDHNTINLLGIHYKSPINGNLELEEALSILADVFYILSPKCADYLTDLKMYNMPFIKRSMQHIIKVTSKISTALDDGDCRNLTHMAECEIPFKNMYNSGRNIIYRDKKGLYVYKEACFTLDDIVNILST